MTVIALIFSMFTACTTEEPAPAGDSTPTPPDDTAVSSPPTDTGWDCNPWYPCKLRRERLRGADLGLRREPGLRCGAEPVGRLCVGVRQPRGLRRDVRHGRRAGRIAADLCRVLVCRGLRPLSEAPCVSDPDDPLDDRIEALRSRLGAVARCPRPAVASLAKRLADRYERAFRDVGITSAQFTVLSAIGFAGETTVTGLTRYVARDQTTLSRSLDRLRSRGWIDVAQPETDRRLHLVRLSPDGVAILEAAMEAWEAVRAELDAQIGVERVEQLIDLAWSVARDLDD